MRFSWLFCPNVCGPVPKLNGEVSACVRLRWHRGWHRDHYDITQWSRGTGHRWASRIAKQVRSSNALRGQKP